MSAQKKYKLISAKKMHATFKSILLKQAFPMKRATECATIFTNNSIDGIYTHGINRFPRFIQYIKQGYIKPDAVPTLSHKFGGIEQWNGNLGAGPSNATFATNRAMKLAKKQGIGCITLSNTNHWMRGGAFGWQAAKAGFALIAWTNTGANMPAWGAINAKLGNNPLVLALPYQDEAIVLDMAMSQFSFGAMELAAMKNEKLSVAGGYDKNNNLTDDPNLILESWRSLPIGYWKGAGLSLLLDILAAVLSGGLAAHEINKQGAEVANSQVFIAIDLSKLGSHNRISQILNNIITDYQQSIAIDNTHKISYPSERVLQTRKLNSVKGVPVLDKVWGEILGLLD
jgi:3-dehydro-L-gulonate 2-dehydrogenase